MQNIRISELTIKRHQLNCSVVIAKIFLHHVKTVKPKSLGVVQYVVIFISSTQKPNAKSHLTLL